jgi:hypothetical protein
MAVLSTDGNIMSGDVVNFISSDEPQYPQLTRLYLEFDFRVLEVSKISGRPTRLHKFMLTYKSRTASNALAITPLFDSLADLERHTDANVLAILEKTVFETTMASAE